MRWRKLMVQLLVFRSGFVTPIAVIDLLKRLRKAPKVRKHERADRAQWGESRERRVYLRSVIADRGARDGDQAADSNICGNNKNMTSSTARQYQHFAHKSHKTLSLLYRRSCESIQPIRHGDSPNERPRSRHLSHSQHRAWSAGHQRWPILDSSEGRRERHDTPGPIDCTAGICRQRKCWEMEHY